MVGAIRLLQWAPQLDGLNGSYEGVYIYKTKTVSTNTILFIYDYNRTSTNKINNIVCVSNYINNKSIDVYIILFTLYITRVFIQ